MAMATAVHELKQNPDIAIKQTQGFLKVKEEANVRAAYESYIKAYPDRLDISLKGIGAVLETLGAKEPKAKSLNPEQLVDHHCPGRARARRLLHQAARTSNLSVPDARTPAKARGPAGLADALERADEAAARGAARHRPHRVRGRAGGDRRAERLRQDHVPQCGRRPGPGQRRRNPGRWPDGDQAGPGPRLRVPERLPVSLAHGSPERELRPGNPGQAHAARR